MKVPPHCENEPLRLVALRRYAVLDTPAEQAYDDLARLAALTCGTPMAMVTLIDEGRQWFKASVGLPVHESPRDIAFCAHTILQADVLVVSDAHADDRFADNPFVAADPHVRFYAGAPLVTPDGFTIGTVAVIDHVPRTLAPPQVEGLRALARQAVALLEMRRQALEDARNRERVRVESALRSIMLGAAGTSAAEVLGGAVRHLAAALDVKYALIATPVAGAPDRLRRVTMWAGDRLVGPFEHDLTDTPCGEVAVARKARFYPDGVESRFPGDTMIKQLGVASYMGVPLFDRARELRGVMAVLHDRPFPDDGVARAVLEAFADRVAADLERLRAEEALAQREEQFRLLAEATFEGIVLIEDDKVAGLNDQLAGMLGYRREDLVGVPVIELVAPEDRLRARDAFRALERGPVEIAGLRRDGTRVQVEVRARAVPRGDRMLRVTSIRDISDRKRMEAALERRLLALTRPLDEPAGLELEELFDLDDLQQLQDQFADATGVASVITRPDGTPVTRPSNFCRLCRDVIRQTPKGRANCHCSDAILGRQHPEGPIVQLCLSGGLWDAGASITVGGRHVGNWLIGQVRNEAQTTDAMRTYAREIGAPEEEFLAAFLEVPQMSEDQFRRVAHTLFTLARQLSAMAFQNVQQARFIEERRRAEEALRESEAKYRTVLESDAFALSLVELEDGRFVEANHAYARLHGYTKQELESGMRLGDIVVAPQASEADLRRADETGEVFVPLRYHRRKDGTVFPVELTVGAFNWKGRRLLAMLTRDVIERQRLEDQLRQAQKMEAVGQLAGGVAHDFNNILAAQMMQLGLLQENMSLDAETRGALAELERSVNRAADLVRQLLLFGRRSFKQPKAVDLNDLVENLLNMLRRLLGEHVKVEWHPAPALPRTDADPSMLEQVVMNLCVNARDAMPRGGALRLSTGLVDVQQGRHAAAPAREGTFLCLSVEDTGCGMDAETLEHMFEPFFTTKEVGKGTGLGLATVHGIVQQHHGWIEVDSEVGRGSTFRVFLPALAPVHTLPAEEPPAAAAAAGGHETILLVEDDDAVRALVTRTLRRQGYEVLGAASGDEALEIWRQRAGEVGLLFTDMVMPGGLSGLDLARQLRVARPDLKVILSSGYGAGATADAGAAPPDIVSLPKPYDLQALAQAVRDALDAPPAAPPAGDDRPQPGS